MTFALALNKNNNLIPEASEILTELDMGEVEFELKHRYVKPQLKKGPQLVLGGWNETDVVNVVRQVQAAGYANLAIYPRGIIDWISHGGVTEVQGGRKRTPLLPPSSTTPTETEAEDRMDYVHLRDLYFSEEDMGHHAEDRRFSNNVSRNRKIHRTAGFGRVDETQIDCELSPSLGLLDLEPTSVKVTNCNVHARFSVST